MRIRIGLTTLVFILFSFGVNQVSRGDSEIAVFKNSLKDFEELNNKKSTLTDELRAAYKSYKNAKNNEKRASAITEIARIRVKRVKTKDAALRALRRAITHFDSVNAIVNESGVKNGYKAGRLGEVEDIMADLIRDLTQEDETFFLTDKEREGINKANEAMIKQLEAVKVANEGILERIEGAPVESRKNGNKALVHNWRKQFALIEKALRVDLAGEKMHAHTIIKISETYNVKNIVTEIFSDLYGHMTFHKLLVEAKKDRLASYGMLDRIVDDLNNTEEIIFKPDEIPQMIEEWVETMPENCDVKDDTYTYCFFDREEGEGRWYTTESGVDDDSVRINAPYDYSVNDGTYVRYENGQWYSFHPSYKGKQVEIYTDAELSEAETADVEKG
jgi:hypothetical protein|tara:strand:+ start:359 stop:1525 length:1167 start_codon:yes stop_codon:yes gene_type:complete